MKDTTTEAIVLKAVLCYLKLRGVFCWRNNQAAVPLPGGGFRAFAGLPGVADVLGVLPGGLLLAVETKRKGGKVTPAQRAFLDAVNRLGGVAVVCDSVQSLERQLAERGF